MHKGIAILHGSIGWRGYRGNIWIQDVRRAFRVNEKTIENGSERLKHAERREMGCVVMRGPRAMSGITSERAPSPTKQSTLTSSLLALPPPLSLPHSRPPPGPPAHSSQFATRVVKALKKQRRGERGPAPEEQKLCKTQRPGWTDADDAVAPYILQVSDSSHPRHAMTVTSDRKS